MFVEQKFLVGVLNAVTKEMPIATCRNDQQNKGNENRKIGMVGMWIGRLLVRSRDRLWRCENGQDGPTPAGWRISWIQRFRNQKIQGVKGFECMKARVRVSGKRGSSELTSPVVPSFSGGSEPVTRLKNPPLPLSLLHCSRLPPKAQPAPASAENPEFLLFAGSTIGDRITFSCTPVSAQPDLVGNSIKVFEKSFSWIWQTRLVVPELLMDNPNSTTPLSSWERQKSSDDADRVKIWEDHLSDVSTKLSLAGQRSEYED